MTLYLYKKVCYIWWVNSKWLYRPWQEPCRFHWLMARMRTCGMAWERFVYITYHYHHGPQLSLNIYIYIHILSLVLFSQDLLSNSCPTVVTAGTLVRSDPPKVPVLISSHCAAGFLARWSCWRSSCGHAKSRWFTDFATWWDGSWPSIRFPMACGAECRWVLCHGWWKDTQICQRLDEAEACQDVACIFTCWLGWIGGIWKLSWKNMV